MKQNGNGKLLEQALVIQKKRASEIMQQLSNPSAQLLNDQERAILSEYQALLEQYVAQLRAQNTSSAK